MRRTQKYLQLQSRPLVQVLRCRSRFVLLISLLLIIILFSPELVSVSENSQITTNQGSTGALALRSPIVEIPLKYESQPLAITLGSNGNVWFAENNATEIVEYNPTNQSFRSFAVPANGSSMIWFMFFDPNGNLWFSNELQPYLWSFSPATDSFAKFYTGGQYVWPYEIVYDNFTNQIWFTSTYTDQIGYFNLNGQNTSLGALINVTGTPTRTIPPMYGPTGIQIGTSGNIFVSEPFSANIVEYSPALQKFISVWKLPPGSQPVGIAIDSAHRAIWFTNHATSLFGFLNMTTGGVTEFATSPYEFFGDTISLPYWVTISTNGMVWIDEHASNKIARYDPTSGVLTEFTIPTNESAPLRFVIDNSRGLVWFTEFFGSNLGMLDENSTCDCGVQLSVRNLTLSSDSVSFYLKYAGPDNNTLTSNSPDPLITGTFRFDGFLTNNLTTKFSVVNSTDYRITLTRGVNLMSGDYSITLCPRTSSADNISSPAPVRQCATTLLFISGNGSSTVYLLASAIAAAIIAVAVVISITLFRRRRGVQK